MTMSLEEILGLCPECDGCGVVYVSYRQQKIVKQRPKKGEGFAIVIPCLNCIGTGFVKESEYEDGYDRSLGRPAAKDR